MSNIHSCKKILPKSKIFSSKSNKYQLKFKILLLNIKLFWVFFPSNFNSLVKELSVHGCRKFSDIIQISRILYSVLIVGASTFYFLTVMFYSTNPCKLLPIAVFHFFQISWVFRRVPSPLKTKKKFIIYYTKKENRGNAKIKYKCNFKIRKHMWSTILKLLFQLKKFLYKWKSCKKS